MRITWLGQAGLFIKTSEAAVLIDPYFSDCVGKIAPEKKRRVPAPDFLWNIKPDFLIFTHDHIDHYDPETAPHFLSMTHPITVLSPSGVWEKARASGGRHNYVLFNEGTEWSEKGIRFSAVKAVHSDPNAVGVVLEAENKTVYIAGDTLFSKKVIEALPSSIDMAFLPVNGAGNNMNMTDAVRFARLSGAKRAVPVHWGMMDDIDSDAFNFENRYIPEIYKEFEV